MESGRSSVASWPSYAFEGFRDVQDSRAIIFKCGLVLKALVPLDCSTFGTEWIISICHWSGTWEAVNERFAAGISLPNMQWDEGSRQEHRLVLKRCDGVGWGCGLPVIHWRLVNGVYLSLSMSARGKRHRLLCRNLIRVHSFSTKCPRHHLFQP